MMSSSNRGSLRHLQAFALAAAAALGGAALYPFTAAARPAPPHAWWLLGGALLLSLLAQLGLPVAGTAVAEPGAPVSRLRRVCGIAVFLAGAALWVSATRWLTVAWDANFDRAWLGWLAGALLMSVGLDVAWARWGPGWRPRRAWSLLLCLLVLFAVGGAYRFGNLRDFPGPYGITQIEDLQFGDWGAEFLAGDRRRWEFIGHAWLSALGIRLMGPTMAAMRTVYALVSNLTVIAVFLWLRFSVGTLGALFGAGLLAVSSWDVVLSRIPFNPNILVVSTVFVLLVGAARRGRPSAFVWMGMLCGYILWEYIAYRPLAVFAVCGGALYSLRERSVGWAARLLRPLLTVAMIASIATPLLLTRLQEQRWYHYFNGLERARSVEGYYGGDRNWSAVFAQRLERAEKTAALFFFEGDLSPTRNLEGRPLVDPVSAVAMLIGFAFCVSHWRRELFGLYAAAFAATATGAMIVTGDFNVLRISVAIPYLYVFAGCAGAALESAWGRAWGRFGKVAAAVVLAAGVGFAAYANTNFLRNYWGSDFVRRAQRSNRAFLVIWLGKNVEPGEQVVGVAPGWEDSLAYNDADWLRGPQIPGVLTTDVITALRRWEKPGSTLFLIFTWKATRDVQKYVEFLVPELHMHFEDDPLDARSELAWGRVPSRPADLPQRLERARCLGISATYEIALRDQPGAVSFGNVVPFIDLSTWPSDFEQRYEAAGASREVRVRYAGRFRVDEAGDYQFSLHVHPGAVTLTVDGRTFERVRSADLHLDAGEHQLELTGLYPSMGRGIELSLFWQGPDTAGKRELMPFYRISAPVPGCADEVSR